MSQTRAEKHETTMVNAEPTKQHRWLQKFVGEWIYEASITEGQPSSKATGTESVRSIKGIWIQAEADGEAPGAGHATSIMTLGYDPEKKRFIGTWIGSMMTHMWIYDGELDAAERVLTLNSEGPSMANDGTMSKYRDVIEFTDDNRRTLTARVLEADGRWKPFMTIEFRRA